MSSLVLRVLVVALAAYRLARALSIDSISAPLRDWLWVGVYGEEPELDAFEQPVEVGGVFWRWAYGLISCPFCIGFWLALGLYALWVNVDWSRPVIAAIAAAGACATLVSIDRAAAHD